MVTESGLEVEVKFLLDDAQAARSRILQAGAAATRARVYERNVRFDTAGEALLRRQELLRLRQDTAVTLTFKAPSAADAASEAKVREEIEVQVSDFAQMALILERLGFVPYQVYEKYREVFRLGDVEILLDEMPYGIFLELEGREEALRDTAVRLGLDWQERILGNYLGIMAMLKEQCQLPFEDVTFANFAGTDISARDILPALRPHNEEQ